MEINLNNKARDWYFTFGTAHRHPNGYVKIFGTFDDCRAEMCSRYGNKWAFQYANAEDAGVDKYKLYEVLYDNMSDEVITDKD